MARGKTASLAGGPALPAMRTARGADAAKSAGSSSYAALVGLRAASNLELAKRIERGVPFNTVEQLRRQLNLSQEAIAQLLQIKPRTFDRRKRQGRLQPQEADRVLRAARVLAHAVRLFDGDAGAAAEWLTTPQRALAEAVPLQLMRTEVGAREVVRLIRQLEEGVFT